MMSVTVFQAAQLALVMLVSVGLAAQETELASCTSGTLESRWDAGNCIRGAAKELWKRENCDAGTHLPGSWTCEKRLAAWNSQHVLLAPEEPLAAAPLVVFLPGTGGAPSDYGHLLVSAQSAGNFVIGLAHLSQPVPVSGMNLWCDAGVEPYGAEECNRLSHESMLRGLNGSTFGSEGGGKGLWDVRPGRSVEALLTGVLQNVVWGSRFLGGVGGGREGEVLWPRIIVSGHSQGAGHAAFWSVARPVLGAALVSGPQDTVAAAAPWLQQAAPEDGVDRRLLISAHEECGPQPRHPVSHCEADALLRNVARMGLSWDASKSAQQWNGTESGAAVSFGDGKGGVVVSFAPPAPTCDSPRVWHCSVALDACAPAGIEAVWRKLFAGFRRPGARRIRGVIDI